MADPEPAPISKDSKTVNAPKISMTEDCALPRESVTSDAPALLPTKSAPVSVPDNSAAEIQSALDKTATLPVVEASKEAIKLKAVAATEKVDAIIALEGAKNDIMHAEREKKEGDVEVKEAALEVKSAKEPQHKAAAHVKLAVAKAKVETAVAKQKTATKTKVLAEKAKQQAEKKEQKADAKLSSTVKAVVANDPVLDSRLARVDLGISGKAAACIGHFEEKGGAKVLAVCPTTKEGTCPAKLHSGCVKLQPIGMTLDSVHLEKLW